MMYFWFTDCGHFKLVVKSVLFSIPNYMSIILLIKRTEHKKAEICFISTVRVSNSKSD